MDKQDLVNRSPVRSFEKAINGGLKAGEIGVLASREGLGKTAVLVQFGLDTLLQDKAVVNVSFNQHSSYVITWYEGMFTEMIKKRSIADAEAVKGEIFRNRVILNFSLEALADGRVFNTLKALSQGGIKPACLVIDGLTKTALTPAVADGLKAFAAENGVAVWFSFSSDETDPDKIFGADVAAKIDTVVLMAQKAGGIVMEVAKAHDAAVKDVSIKLDPKTLLISDK